MSRLTTLAEVERAHIQRALEESAGNVERAAMLIGVPRSTMYQRLARMGLLTKRYQKRRRKGTK